MIGPILTLPPQCKLLSCNHSRRYWAAIQIFNDDLNKTNTVENLIISPKSPSEHLKRQIERFNAYHIKYVVLNGYIFTRSGQIVSTFGSDSGGCQLSTAECRLLLNTLGGSIVRWTSGFRPDNQPGEWYSVICRKFVPLEIITAKRRNEVKRGLRNCSVEQITAEKLADTGYRVWTQAQKRYKNNNNFTLSEQQFRHNILREGGFPDLVHHWAVYSKDKLIGFAQNRPFGGNEINYSSIKLDPEFFDLYPAYALIYKMNEFYLEQQQMAYANDGYRSIFHETNVQNFLIQKFGFEKAYSTLHVYYRFDIRLFIKIGFPIRSILQKIDRRLGALFQLEFCRRNR